MGKISDVGDAARQQVAEATHRVAASVGGPTHLQVILMLAAVLGLVDADLATVSAVADELKTAFHLDNTQIGLLLSTVAYATAAATFPLGLLADRVSRSRLLVIAASCWTLAMLASGFAFSFAYLLVTRVMLGIATAAAWPCVASLTGDFFQPQDRAGAFGLIVAGEFVGAGAGFVVAGGVSSILDWHWAFFAMALPAVALAWAVHRYLPEPQRGSQGWLSMHEPEAQPAERKRRAEAGSGAQSANASVQKKAKQQRIRPREELILRADPRQLGLWKTVGYLLRLPTYRLLIIASSLAYYFLSGVRAFLMIFFTAQWHVSRGTLAGTVAAIGLGALGGVVMGGRISEHLLRKGELNARLLVPAVGLLASVPPFALAFWVHNAWLGVPLTTIGVTLLSAAIAPIDAARLDIVHPDLWGRGEAGRMVLRSALDGSAPVLFGILAVQLGGGTTGLERTMLLMLIPMLAAGSLVIPARRSYARDVMTAAASVQATRQYTDTQARQQRGSGSP
ncbi:MAG TPA: MFS transporter [Steroidobacteraceae bacterium]|nr:MFS transporter [Steroidobacteraceae bacterium]